MEKSVGVSPITNRTCLSKLPGYYADAATPNSPFGDRENVHTCGPSSGLTFLGKEKVIQIQEVHSLLNRQNQKRNSLHYS